MTGLAERCQELCDLLLSPLRERARELGYALALHGSVARDIDLVAIPWTDEAVGARELAEALQAVAKRMHGIASMDPAEQDDYYHREGCPGGRAHGRRVWCYYLGGGPYLDLSVMPRLEEP